MPHTPRTHRLAGGNVASGGLTTLATVPPGERWLVKYATLVHFLGASTGVGLWAAFDGDFAPICRAAALGSGISATFVELYGVLNAGDELQVEYETGGGGGCYFHVGGLIFEL